MIVVKKKILFMLAALLVCFSGCTSEKAPVNNDEQTNISVPENEAENIKEDITETTPDTVPEEIIEAVEAPEILGVNMNSYYLSEMHEDCPEFLAKSKFSSLTLAEDYVKEYPELAETLSQRSAMIVNTMRDEFDNHVAFAYEDVEACGFDGWKPYVSEHNSLVRRADSVAFSVLYDSYSDTSYIQDFRSLMGSSFDSKTGEELLISDVVKDMERLPEILKEEITSHMWTGEFFNDSAIKEYFDNTADADIYFTLDYNGVTVYFYAGSIAEYEYGIITATVSFSEYPEIFNEKYMNVPESYAVRIPVNASFFTDLDNDGETDELIFTAHKNEDFGYYTDFYIITADDFYEENCSAAEYVDDSAQRFEYGFRPYYIKTADNRHILYLYAEGAEDFHRHMRLYMFEITDGKVNKLGEMPLAPHHDVGEDDADVFAEPVNPAEMQLDFFTEDPDFQYPIFNELYRVGTALLPKREGENDEIPDAPEFDPESMTEIEFNEEMLFGTSWQGYVLVDAQSGMPEYCSDDVSDELNITLEFFSDGRGVMKYEGRYCDFDWMNDTETSAALYLGEAGSRYFFVYKDTGSEENPLWIMMQINENILWLYKV